MASTASLRPERPRKSLETMYVEEINAEMGRRRMTQTTMARLLAVSQATVSRELGQKESWSFDDAERYAAALDCHWTFDRGLPRLDSNQKPSGSLLDLAA